MSVDTQCIFNISQCEETLRLTGLSHPVLQERIFLFSNTNCLKHPHGSASRAQCQRSKLKRKTTPDHIPRSDCLTRICYTPAGSTQVRPFQNSLTANQIKHKLPFFIKTEPSWSLATFVHAKMQRVVQFLHSRLVNDLDDEERQR